ncbi:putative mitochondrial protein, partial [Mucuna pruriens]
MSWGIFQLDVKSTFLNGYLEENDKRRSTFKTMSLFVVNMNMFFMLKFFDNGDILLFCLYVDDLIFTGNNPNLFEDFKKVMSCEFDIIDIGLLSYYLGLEVKQMNNDIFVSQESYAKKVLEKFKMFDCNPVNTPMEGSLKLSKFDSGEKEDPTLFKSLVGSLRYLTSTRSDIMYVVGVVCRFIKSPTSTYMKVAKRILRYLKGKLNFSLFYSFSNNFKLMGFCDSDFAGDVDNRKNTIDFVTLSTCEAQYYKNSIDNKSTQILVKNLVFHEQRKHIDTKYHFIREYIVKKEVELVHTLKFEDFRRLRERLGGNGKGEKAPPSTAARPRTVGFSPGPMTLISNFFGDGDECKSFSELLAGAMVDPTTPSPSPMPTFPLPPGFSPSSFLDSPSQYVCISPKEYKKLSHIEGGGPLRMIQSLKFGMMKTISL